MYGRTINFKINGEEFTDKQLLVCIPERYADLFEGNEFHSDEQFSRAIMYAGCAREALIYKCPWKFEEYDRCLKDCLNEE